MTNKPKRIKIIISFLCRSHSLPILFSLFSLFVLSIKRTNFRFLSTRFVEEVANKFSVFLPICFVGKIIQCNGNHKPHRFLFAVTCLSVLWLPIVHVSFYYIVRVFFFFFPVCFQMLYYVVLNFFLERSRLDSVRVDWVSSSRVVKMTRSLVLMLCRRMT